MDILRYIPPEYRPFAAALFITALSLLPACATAKQTYPTERPAKPGIVSTKTPELTKTPSAPIDVDKMLQNQCDQGDNPAQTVLVIQRGEVYRFGPFIIKNTGETTAQFENTRDNPVELRPDNLGFTHFGDPVDQKDPRFAAANPLPTGENLLLVAITCFN